jgi:hypothetical protein
MERTEQTTRGGTTSAVTKNQRSVDEWVSSIDQMITAQRSGVFEVGDHLIQAQNELTKKKFSEVIKQSGIKSRQNAQNYMRVATRKFLRRPEIFRQLPTSVGSLIDLAAWPDKDIEEAIRQEVVRPHAERARLRKWRDQRYHPPKKPPVDAPVVIAYVMCDARTYDFTRAYRLWRKFDEMRRNYLDEDMFITPFDKDLLSSYRLMMLAKRVWDAYSTHAHLFVNPRFHEFVREHKLVEGGPFWQYLTQVAPLIASADHKSLHEIIGFSKHDWSFLGVKDIGHATLLAYMPNPDR